MRPFCCVKKGRLPCGRQSLRYKAFFEELSVERAPFSAGYPAKKRPSARLINIIPIARKCDGNWVKGR